MPNLICTLIEENRVTTTSRTSSSASTFFNCMSVHLGGNGVDEDKNQSFLGRYNIYHFRSCSFIFRRKTENSLYERWRQRQEQGILPSLLFFLKTGVLTSTVLRDFKLLKINLKLLKTVFLKSNLKFNNTLIVKKESERREPI